MAFKGGVEEAAKMIMGLGPAAGKAVLDDIRKRDPKMAALIEKNLVSMNDLQYLTPSMLVGLLRDLNLENFGLALRTVDKDITQKLLDMVSTGIRLEIEDGLKGPLRKLSDVEAAQAEVLDIVRKKVEMGQIVLNPDGDELV
jgi:flagellar motor switch protein FliG